MGEIVRLIRFDDDDDDKMTMTMKMENDHDEDDDGDDGGAAEGGLGDSGPQFLRVRGPLRPQELHDCRIVYGETNFPLVRV